MNQLLVVICTFPSEALVRQIGTHLVEKQLVACVNCFPKIFSIYQWEGEICQDEEAYAIMKVSSENYQAFEEELTRLHPYETPAIVAIKPTHVSEKYMKWILGNSLDELS